MPEIIDGVTYPTTTGGRPYPTASSPGKALWQLLQRAAEELDRFDALLTGATSVQRRSWTKTAQQTVPASSAARVTWVSDTLSGDAGEPANGVKGIRMNAAGLVTIDSPGVYYVAASLLAGSSALWSISLRANRNVIARDSDYGSGSTARRVELNQVLPLAADSTVEIWARNRQNSAYTFPGPYTLLGTETAATVDTPPDNIASDRITFKITRLGAL